MREAAAAADAKLAQSVPTETDYLGAASIYAQLQGLPRAVELLKINLSRFPKSEKLRATLAEIEQQHAKA